MKDNQTKTADVKNKAAGSAATTSKPPTTAATSTPPPTQSSHDVKLSEVAKPKVVATVAAARGKKTETDKGNVDFRQLRTVEELIEAYNDMVPTAVDFGITKIGTVKSFVDVKTGQLACERLHAQILKAREPKPSKVEKTEPAKPVKKESKTMATKTTKSKARKAVRGKTTGKRPVLDDKAKIVVLKKENPFREGSGRHKRVAVLYKSKTVGDFLKKGKRGTLSYCIANKIVKLA